MLEKTMVQEKYKRFQCPVGEAALDPSLRWDDGLYV